MTCLKQGGVRMSPHAVDDIGYPLDPELRRLQARLGTLAGMWRHAKTSSDLLRQQELVEEYRQTLARLYELGWDDALDSDAELPDEYMPEEYFLRAAQRREQAREEWYKRRGKS
jgi:hypothetical protein